MRPIPAGFSLVFHPLQDLAVLKCTQQLVVAGTWFVGTTHDCVHALEGRRGSDALRRNPCTWPDGAVAASRVFQRSHDRRSNRDHAAAALAARSEEHTSE